MGKDTPNTGFFWHVHHGKLLEWCYDAEERREYIRQHKPSNEVETRLRLMQPVQGEIPAEVQEAGRAYEEAAQAHDKAQRAPEEAGRAYEAWLAYEEAALAYDKAWLAYDKALSKHRGAIEALHAKECPDCTWDGREIRFDL